MAWPQLVGTRGCCACLTDEDVLHVPSSSLTQEGPPALHMALTPTLGTHPVTAGGTDTHFWHPLCHCRWHWHPPLALTMSLWVAVPELRPCSLTEETTPCVLSAAFCFTFSILFNPGINNCVSIQNKLLINIQQNYHWGRINTWLHFQSPLLQHWIKTCSKGVLLMIHKNKRWPF